MRRTCLHNKLFLTVSLCLVMAPAAYAGFEWRPPEKTEIVGAPEVGAVPALSVEMESLMPAPEGEVLPPPVMAVPGSLSAPSTRNDVPVQQVVQPIPAPVKHLPAPAPSMPDMEYEIVQGFGTDMPLALALRQIVPAHFAYSFDSGISMGQRVNWNGGRPWNIVLIDALAPLGLSPALSGDTVWVRRGGNMGAGLSARQVAPMPLPDEYTQNDIAKNHLNLTDYEDDDMLPGPVSLAAPYEPTAREVERQDGLARETLYRKRQRPMSEMAMENRHRQDVNRSYPHRQKPDARQASASSISKTKETFPLFEKISSWFGGEEEEVDFNAPRPPAREPVQKIELASQVQADPRDDAPAYTQPREAMTELDDLAPIAPPISEPAQQMQPVISRAEPEYQTPMETAGHDENAHHRRAVMDAFEIGFWQAQQGESLKSILLRWSQKSHVSLLWEADRDYELPSPVQMHGTFPDAVASILQAYNNQSTRPLGTLHPNLPQGPSVLIIRPYEE